MRLWLNDKDNLSSTNYALSTHQHTKHYPNIMTSKERNFEGILFDWDMTLARAMGDVPRSQRLTALFNRGGFLCTHEAVQQAMAEHQEFANKEIPLPSHTTPQTQIDIVAYYQQLLAILGFPGVSQEEALVIYHDYAYLPTDLYDDVLPTLKSLYEQEIQMGIISNHTQEARTMMQTYVGDFIPASHIFISDEIGLYKPLPVVFLQAAKHLNLPPEQCVYVGDNLQIDAIGAVEKGGFGLGLWLDRKNALAPGELPQHVIRITTLTEVLDYL
ncbi:MAG: HAD family hydrolase [Ardenticatenaceae bacterium]|nr:HAD family hydrolase [Anaerolineales bacterium]MCB8920737.1 HAD family hydrolase [Ardenticatenaceae bacterium]MCB8989696.1 HAD family hydrolase [Ardenticatenaceae bacterium]MCB9002845.1 HAD family hydrolase [Ardenticatenaceae bacterium]